MKSFPFISELYCKVGEVEVLKNRASASDHARARYTVAALEDSLSRIKKAHAIRILEVGPGSGFITEHLIGYINRNSVDAKLDICDISGSFLTTCGNYGKEINKSVTADICSLDDCNLFSNEKYNVILFEEALEHTASPFSAVYNINRLLAEEGKLILTVPNTLYARRLFTELSPTRKLTGKYLDTHIAEMTPLSLVKLLSMAGFEVDDISYYASDWRFAKRLASSQVGFTCTKKREPYEAWNELTSRILDTWKQC